MVTQRTHIYDSIDFFSDSDSDVVRKEKRPASVEPHSPHTLEGGGSLASRKETPSSGSFVPRRDEERKNQVLLRAGVTLSVNEGGRGPAQPSLPGGTSAPSLTSSHALPILSLFLPSPVSLAFLPLHILLQRPLAHPYPPASFLTAPLSPKHTHITLDVHLRRPPIHGHYRDARPSTSSYHPRPPFLHSFLPRLPRPPQDRGRLCRCAPPLTPLFFPSSYVYLTPAIVVCDGFQPSLRKKPRSRRTRSSPPRRRRQRS